MHPEAIQQTPFPHLTTMRCSHDKTKLCRDNLKACPEWGYSCFEDGSELHRHDKAICNVCQQQAAITEPVQG